MNPQRPRVEMETIFNFIKKCWHFIGTELTQCVSNTFSISTLPRKANMTWLTLVPKVDDIKEIKDYKPISMIGCIYKVIVKVLANRMRSIMDGLVEILR